MARNNNFDRNDNRNDLQTLQNNRQQYQHHDFSQAAKPSWKDKVKEKIKGKAKAFLLGGAYVAVTWAATEICNRILDEYENMDK